MTDTATRPNGRPPIPPERRLKHLRQIGLNDEMHELVEKYGGSAFVRGCIWDVVKNIKDGELGLVKNNDGLPLEFCGKAATQEVAQ
jgi:hypothetical protein